MNDENDGLRVDTTPDTELQADADATEAFKVPSYEVAPEDKPIADAIQAMDWLTDVPSPFKGFSNIKPPEMKLSSLPPAMRASVEKQLAYTPPADRDEAERKLVRAALESHSREVRSQAGVGEGALPYHQTLAELNANYRQLGREFDNISAQLTEVSHHDTRVDPATGQRSPVPVLAVQGPARAGLVRELEQLTYRMKLLGGVEGHRLLDKALLESVELVKKRNAQASEERQTQVEAERMVREGRLKRRAEARARSIDPNVFSRD